MRDEDKKKEQLISKLKDVQSDYNKLDRMLNMLPIGLNITDNEGEIPRNNQLTRVNIGQKEYHINSFIYLEQRLRTININDLQVIRETDKNLRKQRQYLEYLLEKRTRELAEANEKFISITENITEGFFLLDKNWRFVYINSAMCCSFNKKRNELLGKSLWEVFPNATNSTFYKEYHRVMLEQVSTHFETYSIDGKIYYDIKSYPYKDGIAVLATDITEKKKYEYEIAKLSRLNLIGEMAAGISHEVRNPMTTVRGFLQMLSEKQDCAKYRSYFELMIEELDRANSIIAEFLSIGKSTPSVLKRKNLNSIIKAIIPLIQADAVGQDKYVEVETSDIPDIMLYGREIRQVILNLCRNGLDAMSRGKCLKIRTFLVI